MRKIRVELCFQFDRLPLSGGNSVALYDYYIITHLSTSIVCSSTVWNGQLLLCVCEWRPNKYSKPLGIKKNGGGHRKTATGRRGDSCRVLSPDSISKKQLMIIHWIEENQPSRNKRWPKWLFSAVNFSFIPSFIGHDSTRVDTARYNRLKADDNKDGARLFWRHYDGSTPQRYQKTLGIGCQTIRTPKCQRSTDVS